MVTGSLALQRLPRSGPHQPGPVGSKVPGAKHPALLREAGGSATAGARMELALDVLSTAPSEFGCCVDWRQDHGWCRVRGLRTPKSIQAGRPEHRYCGRSFRVFDDGRSKASVAVYYPVTVVRLGNGDLFIHSPIAFEPALADRLQAMGTVRHLVSPNQFHYAHIGEWSRAFPGAIAWASPRARKRARSRGIDVRFDRDIGVEPPEEWRAEIDQTAVPGGIFGEIVFFHKESKTLILADTIINLELDKIRQPWRFAAKLTGMYYPRGQIFFGMRLPLLLQKRKTRAAVQRMLSWQPERIILSHGRWFDSNASETLERTFGWAL
jgi:hypothetical protein